MGKLRQPQKKPGQQQTKHPPSPDSEFTEHTPNIVKLQSVIGNQAVQRLYRPGQKVQRADTGLRSETERQEYTKIAQNLWLDQTNTARPIKEVLQEVVAAVKGRLKGNGVPEPKKVVFSQESGQFGSFIPGSWTLVVDPNSPMENRSFGSYGQPQYAKLVEVLYHEARHAEQRFLIARWLAGRRISSPDIAKELGIPLDIAQQASKNRLLSSTGDPELLEQAEHWYKFTGHNGMYADLQPVIEDFDEEVLKIINLINNAPEDKYQRFVPEVEKLVANLGRNFGSKFGKLLKTAQKARPKTEADETVIEILDIMNDQLDAVQDGWAAAQSDMNYTSLTAFGLNVLKLRADVKHADDMIPTEMDALETGWFVAMEVSMLRLR